METPKRPYLRRNRRADGRLPKASLMLSLMLPTPSCIGALRPIIPQKDDRSADAIPARLSRSAEFPEAS